MILMNRIVWEIYDRHGSVDFPVCVWKGTAYIGGAYIKIDVVWVNLYVCIWYDDDDTLHTSMFYITLSQP